MPANYNSRSARGELAERARDLAATTEALADKIAALHQDIRAADEGCRRAGFRCSTTIGSLYQAAGELRDTAFDLDRIAAATVPGMCGVPWGVCPGHGNTLTSSGGRTWCRDTDCLRSWGYDRSGLPCAEPACWEVTDQRGTTAPMCDGHARTARTSLIGCRVVPLTAARKERS
jgi:hypothetical protein